MQRVTSHITKGVMSMNVDGHPSRGRPKKRLMDCVKDDMRIKGVSMDMTSDRREWKKRNVVPTPLSGIRGTMISVKYEFIKAKLCSIT
jgi:hypothetical protein